MIKRYIIWHTNPLVRNEFNFIMFILSLMQILSSVIITFILWKDSQELIRMAILGLIIQAYLILYFIITKGYK